MQPPDLVEVVEGTTADLVEPHTAPRELHPMHVPHHAMAHMPHPVRPHHAVDREPHTTAHELRKPVPDTATRGSLA